MITSPDYSTIPPAFVYFGACAVPEMAALNESMIRTAEALTANADAGVDTPASLLERVNQHTDETMAVADRLAIVKTVPTFAAVVGDIRHLLRRSHALLSEVNSLSGDARTGPK